MLDRLLARSLVALTLGIVGPAHALEPIQNLENIAIMTKTGEPASPQEVRDAIVAAGLGMKWEGRGRGDLKWQFDDAGPGRLRGTLVVHGRHIVEVDIPYTADRYSVVYVDSQNMNYKDDGGVRVIHPNYNVWVGQFVQRVSIQLASLVPGVASTARQSGGDSLAEVSFWESVRNSTNPMELQAYLDQYPNGRFAILARSRLAALGVAPKLTPPAPVAVAPAAAAKPAALPSWNDRVPRVGDSWTYRLVPKGRSRVGIKKYLVTVTAASDSGIRDRNMMEGAQLVELDHSTGRYIAPLGALSLFSPYLVAFHVITPGSRLSDIENLDPRTCPPAWSCSMRGRVMAQETITVPAGTFSTIKVDLEQKWTGPRLTHDREVGGRALTVWYAPEIKRAVKYASRNLQSGQSGPQSILIETEFELDLVFYKLN